MGRIVSRITDDGATVAEVWTGSPGSGLVHLGTGDNEPVLSLTPHQAEQLSVLLAAARTRLIGWRQALLDVDIVLDAFDTAALNIDEDDQ